MRILLILLSIFSFVVTGCTQQHTTSDYPPVVMWNDELFHVSAETVKIDMIGKQLGEVTKSVRPMPKENGQSNTAPKGSKIFEFKDQTPNSIVVEYNGEYRRATK